MNAPPCEAELRDTLSRMFKLDASQIGLDADLVMELGLDSLASLRLLAAVEKQFKMRFPDQRLSEYRTLRQLMECIVTRPNQGDHL